LFAASDTVVEDRGRSKEAKPSIMKVSLREQSEERVINERPESFYFAKYTDKQREQFQQCAVSSDDIYQQMYIVDTQPWKCLNLNAGKKKRQLKIVCRQRKLEKAKMKKLEEEKLKKLMKKQKFQQKFNGKPNQRQGKGRKPMAGNKKQPPKPKYRTE